MPGYKSRAHKDFPSDAAEEFRKECLTGLYQRQLEVRFNPRAVEVVVHVAMDVTRCELVGILFEEELSADGKSAAAVIGNQSGCANRGRRGNLVLGAEGEDIAKYRNNSSTDGRTRYGKWRDDKCPSCGLLLFFRRLLRLCRGSGLLVLRSCGLGRILL